MATAENRCDICQRMVPTSPNDEEGREPFSLAEHRWSAHGILGVTRCGHCGEPMQTDGLAEHLALTHDLPPPSDTQRTEREARRRQRADDDLRDELRQFLREAREARSPLLAPGGDAVSPSLGFAGTVAAVVCALLLFPIAQRVVAWVLDMIGLLLGLLIHAASRKV